MHAIVLNKKLCFNKYQIQDKKSTILNSGFRIRINGIRIQNLLFAESGYRPRPFYDNWFKRHLKPSSHNNLYFQNMEFIILLFGFLGSGYENRIADPDPDPTVFVSRLLKVRNLRIHSPAVNLLA